ncbi:UDP-N-acetylglucosamine transferase subunit ALG14 [Salinarimonas soli]|nr:UDP-N-acetylglucosamine transferase subunit ALG14 [Salinarimonas soli]
MRLRPAFRGCEIVFVSTLDQGNATGGARFHRVPDANRFEKLTLVKLFVAMVRILLVERPDVVVSTGAAPGYIALRLGSLLGARTVWIDSIANVDELSMSGRMATKVADLCLTQWPHLARPEGPHFAGSVV